MMKEALINIQNVELKLGTLPKPILHNINYKIYDGDFIILLGSNGSGKSSLLKIINRLYRATKGSVMLDGADIQTHTNREFYRRVITLTQNCKDSLFGSLTVLENCIMAKQRYATDLFSIGINSCERKFFAEYLRSFNTNLAYKFNVVASSLSGGEQQALALALSVLYKPQILLLDEHTSALDPRTAKHLMEVTDRFIQENRITCILTTHNLDIALHYGNRILALQNGEVINKFEHNGKQNLKEQDLLEIYM